MAKTLAEKIAVMQAYQNGKEIEFRSLSEGSSQPWLSAYDQDLLWNWGICDYRIKPNTYWVNLYKDPCGVSGVIVGYRYKSKADATACFKAADFITCVEITE